MAESADKDSKTEEATEKKIRDAVEKGQLPHSKEAPILASFVAILIFTVFFAKDSAVQMSGFLATFIEKPHAWPIETGVDVANLLGIVFSQVGKAFVGDADPVDGCRHRSLGAPARAEPRRRPHHAEILAHLDQRGLEAAVRCARDARSS